MYSRILTPTNLLTFLLIFVALFLLLRVNKSDRTMSFNLTNTIRRFHCDDINPITQYKSRGDYYVLYNYIKATKSFRCDESITYTTNADCTFLDNVIPILERWGGPVSLSIYAPGHDFAKALNRIAYLRECVPASNLVKEFVTFHIFFDRTHLPNFPVGDFESFNFKDVCSFDTSTLFGKQVTTYRKNANLTYPINVARNIAKEMATTHYVFASDIELYPSPNLIPKFLNMIQKKSSLADLTRPKVFVLSVFEIEETATIPTKKSKLLQMLKDGSAVPFHKNMCQFCHKIPKANKWMKDPGDDDLHVFHSAKRHKPFDRWEPFYIGTKTDPEFDERLSWEGKANKMTQGYLMCVMDYDFLILDNAFLIHRPGIKTKADIRRPPEEKTQARFIRTVIKKEYDKVYGKRKTCRIF